MRNRRAPRKPDQGRACLAQHLAELQQARQHLDYSFGQVQALPDTLAGATAGQLASVEAFCSRFARAVDLLVNKVLRSLDRVELRPEGTLLDVVNRAEKRGLIERATDLREMNDVRNLIAHDYAGAKTAEIFAYCREQKPLLDAVCDRVAEHGRQILSGSGSTAGLDALGDLNQGILFTSYGHFDFVSASSDVEQLNRATELFFSRPGFLPSETMLLRVEASGGLNAYDQPKRIGGWAERP